MQTYLFYLSIVELQERIEQLKAKRHSLFAVSELQKHKYVLHAILIHDGEAGMGHYWAFIHDHATGIWRRFNDTNVSVETEDNVIAESYGGKGTASAYCLVYARADAFQQGSSVQRSVDLVPTALQSFIGEDNDKFEAEMQKWTETTASATASVQPFGMFIMRSFILFY